jgi:thiamine biosynthesis lipoprotein
MARSFTNFSRVLARGFGLWALGLAIATVFCAPDAPPGLVPPASHAVAAIAPSTPARRSVTWAMHTMGTYAHVVLVSADSAADAPRAAIAESVLARIDSLMSNWTTTSEVARLNREAGHATTTVEPQVAVVIDSSLALWHESDHTFDITVEPMMRAWGFLGGPKRVPSDDEQREAFRHVGAQRVHFDRARRTIRFDDDSVHIDLGGIAKGYAVEVAAQALAKAGVTDALVDLTGNMAALGHPADSDRWRIGIRDPRDRMPYFARISLLPGEAISTSGKYEQFIAKDGKTYGHIMDPRTGHPADGLISVTVISRSAFTCDSWDTPLFVLGATDACRKAKAHSDFAAVLVSPGSDGIDTVFVESSLADRFALEPEALAKFRVVVF